MKNSKGNRLVALMALVTPVIMGQSALAAEYKLDTAHSFIDFRIQHLGYSWLHGRFNTFEGGFTYDESDPSNLSTSIEILTDSIDSNHAERDKHLKGDDFLSVSEYPIATFISTAYKAEGAGAGTLKGDLTLHGVTKPVEIQVVAIGGGEDPWGNMRQGFEGATVLTLADFGIDYNLGPKSKTVELMISVEGVKQ